MLTVSLFNAIAVGFGAELINVSFPTPIHFQVQNVVRLSNIDNIQVGFSLFLHSYVEARYGKHSYKIRTITI